jgi:heme/copper-type cytochrome/quinol oxidase subunit 2
MTDEPKKPKLRKSQVKLLVMLAVLTVAFLYFKFLEQNGLNDSAALYLGVPMLIAAGMVLLPESKSLMGATMKTLTIALLLSAPLLEEGFICILMAAPILYGVAATIAALITRFRKKRGDNDSRTLRLSGLSIAILAIASLEGTHQSLTFDRYDSITKSTVVEANIEEIRAKLAESPDFTKERPFFLRVFPLPTSVEGDGLEVGDTRKLNFTYYKWFYYKPHIGSATVKVTENQNDTIRFEVIHDDSYVSNYLRWKTGKIQLEAIDDNHTKIAWNISYERKLDPAWYFGPLQHYAVSLTADVLIDNVATPNS